MRCLLGTLLATSHPMRHGPPLLFGDSQPQLAIEEYKALAGVWRAELELDGGATHLSLHLADPQLQQMAFAPTSSAPVTERNAEPYSTGWRTYTDCDLPSGGDVYLDEVSLPASLPRELGWTSARWSVSRDVHAGAEGDDVLSISVQLGNIYLEGRGQRGGLRCRTFVGKVFEGHDYPRLIGRFSLRLSLPIKTETFALEKQYQRRIASSPSPSRTTAPDRRCEVLSKLLRACAVAAEVAEEETHLADDCEAGDDMACEVLSREEEAKRAWLARLHAPSCETRGDHDGRMVSREEEAKRAWLARLNSPTSWGPGAHKHDHVSDDG